MTYQKFAQFAVKFTIGLMIVLFSWVSYHQLMGMETMSMESGSCQAFCYFTTHLDVAAVTQAFYYSFTQIFLAVLTVAVIAALSYCLRLYFNHGLDSSPPLFRLKQYYQQQRWKLQQFSVWSKLYQEGIVAPQLYS